MSLDLGTDQLHARVEGPIGWICFDNPGRHNALSREMLAALPRAVQALETDDAVRVVVMRGAGERAFVSGADLRQVEGFRGVRPRASEARGGALSELEKPLIAMIHGWCLGGGLLTALWADLRVAAEDARFGIPAAKLGVGYPYDSTQALLAAVGPAAASEILLTGGQFDARDALRLGLVNRVVPKAELEAEVTKLARTIAGNAPLTLRAAKACIRDGLREPAERRREECEKLVERCWASEDFREGRLAFAEKREPRFQAR